MTEQEDDHFSATVTWNPPVYPYKTLTLYMVRWSNEDGFEKTSFTVSVFCFVLFCFLLIIYIYIYIFHIYISFTKMSFTQLENHSQLLCGRDFANERLFLSQFDV